MDEDEIAEQKAEADHRKSATHANGEAWIAEPGHVWRDLLARGAVFDMAEPRVNAAWRASLVHLLLATRERKDQRFQTSGLP